MQISIIIPLYNECESLPELHTWILNTMHAHELSYEIIFIDDGSTDTSWAVITSLQKNNACVRGIKFRRNYGKSAALQKGFEAAKGDVIITMDADLQDSPDEIPQLYQRIVHENLDLISGWKQKRYDPLTKTLPTKLFNWATQQMSGIYNLHDFNCGLKAYRSQVVKSIEVYGEMHRYIPFIAKRAGFNKISEQVVQHQARKYGTTKFGWERFINGFLDLLSIAFVSKFGKRPMHFFGSLGVLMFGIGLAAAVYMGAHKVFCLYVAHTPARLIATQPQFYIALTCMVLGTQLFLAGFIGELIARTATDRNTYLIECEI